MKSQIENPSHQARILLYKKLFISFFGVLQRNRTNRIREEREPERGSFILRNWLM